MFQEVESGRTVKDVCREHGIATGTYYSWKAKYGDMDVNEARWLKELETENSLLKAAIADLTLREQAPKGRVDKKMMTPVARRAGVRSARSTSWVMQLDCVW